MLPVYLPFYTNKRFFCDALLVKEALLKKIFNWIFSDKEFQHDYIHPVAACILKSLLDHTESWNFLEVTNQLMVWLVMKYKGTTQIKDRYLLAIILNVEKRGFYIVRFMISWHLHSLIEWETQISDFNHAERGLENQIDASIAAIEGSIMWKTIEQFSTQNSLNSNSLITHERPSHVLKAYDPHFFLPLLYFISKYNHQSNFRKLFEVNLVGLAIMTLSSEDITTRQIGSCILYHIYRHLEQHSHHLQEHSQLLHFLYTFKNTITLVEEDEEPNNRLSCGRTVAPVVVQIPFVFCLFVAKSISVLLRPNHTLYRKINQFTLQRALIDPRDVPLFYTLFHSTHEDNYRQARYFLLNLLGPSLKSLKDFQVFQRRHVIELLCSLYQSSIGGMTSLRKSILEVSN